MHLTVRFEDEMPGADWKVILNDVVERVSEVPAMALPFEHDCTYDLTPSDFSTGTETIGFAFLRPGMPPATFLLPRI